MGDPGSRIGPTGTGEFDVDPETVRRVRRMLREGDERLDGQRVDPCPQESFPATTGGSAMTYHAERARVHVEALLHDERAGLRSYDDAVSTMDRGADETEQQTADRHARQQARLEAGADLSTRRHLCDPPVDPQSGPVAGGVLDASGRDS